MTKIQATDDKPSPMKLASIAEVRTCRRPVATNWSPEGMRSTRRKSEAQITADLFAQSHEQEDEIRRQLRSIGWEV